MIKKRVYQVAVCFLILFCMSFILSCNFINRSTSITILLVEDQELTALHSTGAESQHNPEFVRSGLLIYNTGIRTASFIPVMYNRQLPESDTLDSVEEWVEEKFSLKIDYSALVSGDSGKNLYEVLASLSEPVQSQNQDSAGQEKWNTLTNNAELFLQDEVFRHILSAVGGFIPEKIVRNFISMYIEDGTDFYYMRNMVIDINSVNGYLYEREYIRQVYSAQLESVKE